MGLFGKKMTFNEAVAILSDFGADKKEKDKAVKAMDRFPRSERFACSALLWLQKGNPEAAALSLCVLPWQNKTRSGKTESRSQHLLFMLRHRRKKEPPAVLQIKDSARHLSSEACRRKNNKVF